MPINPRLFRGSHKNRLERLGKYGTFTSILTSKDFAQTLNSEEPTVIDLFEEEIAFTDQDESDEERVTRSDSLDNKTKQKHENPLAYGSSCGLYNPGQNICFMNSVIQTLINLPYITPCLLSGQHKSNCILRSKSLFCSLCLLESLAQKAHTIKGAVNNPFFSITKKAIWSKYVPGKQQDSHEFLRYLVDSFSTPMGSKPNPESFKKSLIGRAFHGTLKSVVKCLYCGYFSEKLENFLDVAIDITKDDLDNCIADFIKPQKLSGSNKYHCPKCKTKRDATLSFNFNKLPLILCIALKRFNYGTFGFQKTLKSLRYPQHMAINRVRFELSALVCHLGHSLYSGHYIAYAKGGHGFWNKFDDSHVTLLEKHQMLSQTSSVYLLFYAQENVDSYQTLLLDGLPTIKGRGRPPGSGNKKDTIGNEAKTDSVLNPFIRLKNRVDMSTSNVVGIRTRSATGARDYMASQSGNSSRALLSGLSTGSSDVGGEGEVGSWREGREGLRERNGGILGVKSRDDIEYDMGRVKKVKKKQIFSGVTGNSGMKRLVVTGKSDFDKLNSEPIATRRSMRQRKHKFINRG